MACGTRQRILFAASLTAILMIAGCENSFDPRGPFEKRLVVYSVLSNRSDSQYVRIYTTYNPSGYNPLENASDTYVRNAKVTITDDSATYTLKETSVPRDDRSRYNSDVVAYGAYPCTLHPGKQYTLTVTSDQGNATATVSVPGRGSIYNNTPLVLADPYIHRYDIPVSINLSSGAQAFLVRLYIDFNAWDGQALIHKRSEVPLAGDTTGESQLFIYPTLLRRPSAAYTSVNLVYPYSMYLALYIYLQHLYGPINVTGATFILTQVESNLYNYYNVANGFRDPYSVREDQPDYTNIVGEFGVFGAMVEDSLVVDVQPPLQTHR